MTPREAMTASTTALRSILDDLRIAASRTGKVGGNDYCALCGENNIHDAECPIPRLEAALSEPPQATGHDFAGLATFIESHCAGKSTALLSREWIDEITASLRAAADMQRQRDEARANAARKHSGCACTFDEEGDKIIDWCKFHAEARDKTLAALASSRQDCYKAARAMEGYLNRAEAAEARIVILEAALQKIAGLTIGNYVSGTWAPAAIAHTALAGGQEGGEHG